MRSFPKTLLWKVSQIDQLLNGYALGFGIFFCGGIDHNFHALQCRLAIVRRCPKVPS